MAVPTSITDLSTTAASNSPAGSDSIGNPGQIDDYFRGYGAVQRAESLNKSWERWHHTCTFISATSFSVATDLTAVYTVPRRVKCTVTAGTVYGRISASVFGAVTTVTVVLDSGALDSGLSEVQLGPDTKAFWTTSAGLAAQLSDETGSGALVFGTSPTITTPLLSGNVGAGTASPRTQLVVDGVGQSTTSFADAGNLGSALFLRDTGGAASSGGALLFGGAGATDLWFAGIKGLLTNGGSNTIGDLGFLFRSSTVSTSLTERFHMTTDGRFYGTALHNNAGAVTGTTNQYIASGTYTPTLTNAANCASLSANVCQWLRVGNVVTVSGLANVTLTSSVAGTFTEFFVSLPIASTTTNPNVAGAGAFSDSNVAMVPIQIYGEAVGSNRAVLSFYIKDGSGGLTATFTFTYLVA